jgi:NAD(P)H-hydrate epimerase
LRYCDLEIPEEFRCAETPVMRRIDDAVVSSTLGLRARIAHKGDFGHVLIVGGGPGMPGAVRICGEAALRAGAGLVTIATHPSHSALIPIARPELMCHGVESADQLESLLARASVIAIGPGLGKGKWSNTLFEAILASDLPVVVDADALNLLAGPTTRRGGWILTPHPGEAARLLGTGAADVQADRRAALAALADKFMATIVLKGAGTLISAGKAAPWLCSAGNPGMASPGMGDALTGIIAAFWAQGLSE